MTLSCRSTRAWCSTDTTQKYILRGSDCQVNRSSLPNIGEAIEELTNLDISSRLVKMDLSAVAQPEREDERYTDAEFSVLYAYWSADAGGKGREKKRVKSRPEHHWVR